MELCFARLKLGELTYKLKPFIASMALPSRLKFKIRSQINRNITHNMNRSLTLLSVNHVLTYADNCLTSILTPRF